MDPVRFSGTFMFYPKDFGAGGKALDKMEATARTSANIRKNQIAFPKTDQYDAKYAACLKTEGVNLEQVSYESNDKTKIGSASEFFA